MSPDPAPAADLVRIQEAETGLVHRSVGGFETACGRRLEWGFYVIGGEVPVTGDCFACAQTDGGDDGR